MMFLKVNKSVLIISYLHKIYLNLSLANSNLENYAWSLQIKFICACLKG